MSGNNNTVVSLKSAFLRTQTRILSQPLQAPERWRSGNLDASNIPESVIKDVVREVNRLVRRHNKSAYPSLAIRHVADQIDALYWTAAAPPLSIPHHPSTYPDSHTTTLDPLHPSADLTTSNAIGALASTWAEASDQDVRQRDVEAAQRYEELVQRLQELDERRREAKARLERYRRLRGMVEALREPRERVQANLVTREGELARGVAEAKTLSVRVGARVVGWADGREVDREEDKMVDVGRSRDVEAEKLMRLLED